MTDPVTELEKQVAKHDVLLSNLEKRMSELHIDIRLLHTSIANLTTQLGILTAKMPEPLKPNMPQLAAVGTVSGAIGAVVVKALQALGVTF